MSRRRYQGSIMSGTYRPFLTPNAPTSIVATAGNASASVAFVAPANVGGGAITSYTVVSSGGQYATGTSSPLIVTGLTNGTSYTFTVYASNTYGPGQRSVTSSAITPTAAATATLSLWGGGGGGDGGYTNLGYGGAGGAATATISLGAITSGVIVIGGGGQAMAPDAGPGPAVPGGGGTAGALGYAGQGGGYTGLFITSASQANAVVIAGGGGGSSAVSGRNGGAGGGTTGQTGGGAGAGGGGTQSGSSGYPAGTALQGGSPDTPDYGGGGGGGGGYWGGGGGGNGSPTDSGGGGGSGYSHPTRTITATLYAGSGTTAGDSSNALRGSYGNAGFATGAGTQGVFYLEYPDTYPALTSTTGSPTITVSGGIRRYRWTSAGSFTV